MPKIITILIVIFASSSLFSEKIITLDNVTKSVVVDGLIEESEWASSKVVEDFV